MSADTADDAAGRPTRSADAQREYGSITKQLRIDAPPAVVYEVVSTPEHVATWWTDEADFDSAPGGRGVLAWAGKATTKPFEVEITVVEARPGELFSFRWLYPDGEPAEAANSMLVTFTLAPDGPDGQATLLTLVEEGMREKGWEAAVLEDYYHSHDDGWTRHLADLAVYAPTVAAR